MKLLVTADVHLHNKPYDNSLALGRQLLWDLIKVAKQDGCSKIVIVGDLWDQKHATPVEVLLLIQEWIDELEREGIDLIWVRGNHECQSRTNPEESLILLFDNKLIEDVCIVNSPDRHEYSVINKDRYTPEHSPGKFTKVYLHFVPWYPTEVIKEHFNQCHMFAMQNKHAKHILFAHCGLREGKVSADGFRVPKDLSVKHLQPDLYEFVILGDYHGHQFLADNVLYVGEPTPRTFGSFDSVGVWVLDLGKERVHLESKVLPSRFPRFYTTHVKNSGDLSKVLDSFDRHRITCPASLLPQVTARYPFAEVIAIDEKELGGPERSPKVYLSNHEEVLKEYISRHYPKEDKAFLARAMNYLKGE